MTLTKRLDKIQETVNYAARTEYRAHWIDKKLCVGSDWDLQQAACWKTFDNKAEAQECIKDKYFKGKPFYWQPGVDSIKHDETPKYSSRNLKSLIAVVRELSGALADITQEPWSMDPAIKSSDIARNALSRAEQLLNGGE